MSTIFVETFAPDIIVNTISPGYIKTSWHGSKKVVLKKAKEYEKQVLLKRSANPEEVTKTVLWYVEAPNLVTGENIFIDAGLHLQS